MNKFKIVLRAPGCVFINGPQGLVAIPDSEIGRTFRYEDNDHLTVIADSEEVKQCTL